MDDVNASYGEDPTPYSLPPQFSEPPVRGRRSRLWIAAAFGAIMLLVGGIAGGFLTFKTNAFGVSTAHLVSASVPSLPAQKVTANQQINVPAVASALGPAVATIVVQTVQGPALGSGFVFAHDSRHSYLLTNNHVIAGATSIEVLMPSGLSLTGTVNGADAVADLAVVSVDNASLPMASFGQSSTVVVGQPVVAIGSPLGNAGTVTTGVISVLQETITAGDSATGTSETLPDVMQTSAAINPGNSGGPLANAAGQVIGVNVATATQANNIGYAIPSQLAQKEAYQLIDGQTIHHPFLGVAYLTTVDAAEQGKPFSGPGDYVVSVQANTAAAQAGLRAGDIITAINGVTIANGQTLAGLLATSSVGEQITITVKRNGQSLKLTATLGTNPNAAA